jgi:hypothetical protein
MNARISFVERAVLKAVELCPAGQMRCLLKKARKFAPGWGLDHNDITWGIRRLTKSGILSPYGHGGRGAIFYRMANPRRRRRNSCSCARRMARIRRGSTPREARRLLKRWYKRRNPLRPYSYRVRFQKLIRREEKRLKQQSRKARLARLRAHKKGR